MPRDDDQDANSTTLISIMYQTPTSNTPRETRLQRTAWIQLAKGTSGVTIDEINFVLLKGLLLDGRMAIHLL